MTLTALPKIPLFILGTSCGGLAWILTKNEKKVVAAAAMKEREKAAKKEPEKVEKLLDLDVMELEIGYGLVRLVDGSRGRLSAGRGRIRPSAGELRRSGICCPPRRRRHVKKEVHLIYLAAARREQRRVPSK